MNFKKQIENYFKYNSVIGGEILFFDEMPKVIIKKNTISTLASNTLASSTSSNNTLASNTLASSTSSNNTLASNIVASNTLASSTLSNNTLASNIPAQHKVSNNTYNSVSNSELKNQNICLASTNLSVETDDVPQNHIEAQNKILPNLSDIKTLDELRSAITDCQCCSLGATRNKLVFGSGNPNADLLVIGEAPGADEDIQGEPFVGRAGQLLTDILRAIKFERNDVYIANICKCRPPGNRRPSTEEVYYCEQYLKKQIEFISPKFILALGLTAVDALFKKTHKMADVRGQFLDYYGIKTMVTYHPAALLRNPGWKRPVWEDVQLLRKMYDKQLSNY